MPTITTKEATIQTFQVEIQTLRVNNKQVTMGLFRQLPLGRLIDNDTVTFNGIPWGHVQYWWDSDGRTDYKTYNKLHIVWQFGNTLQRSIVETDISLYLDTYETEEIIASTDYVLRTIPMCTDVQCLLDHNNTWLMPTDNIRLNGKPWTIWLSTRGEIIHVTEYLRQLRSPDPGIVQNAKKNYAEFLQHRGILHRQSDDLRKRHLASVEKTALYRARWESRIKELCDLPQLFIAV